MLQFLKNKILSRDVKRLIYFRIASIASRLLYGLKSSAFVYRSYCSIKRIHWLFDKKSLKISPVAYLDYNMISSDADLVKSIIESYNDAIEIGSFEVSKHWSQNIISNASEFEHNLRNQNVAFCLNYLRSMFIQPGLRGISMSDEFYSNKKDMLMNHTIIHSIVSFSEYLGLSPTECIEIGGIKRYNLDQLSKLLHKIENIFKVDNLSFPKLFGAYGIKIKDSFVTVDMFEHLYSLQRAHDVYCAFHEQKPANWLEIGGGFGDACFWSKKLFNISSYTIVDLPYTAVFQAWFLSKTLGFENINLFNSKSFSFSNTKINLIPPFYIKEFESSTIDLAWNQNSFPEMNVDIIKGYVTNLERVLKPHGLLYSYNQEAQVLVPPILHESKIFRKISRTPSWTRAGYVEEVYQKHINF